MTGIFRDAEDPSLQPLIGIFNRDLAGWRPEYAFCYTWTACVSDSNRQKRPPSSLQT